jgi:hypothetical protein
MHKIIDLAIKIKYILALSLSVAVLFFVFGVTSAVDNPQYGGIGLSGSISSDPPTQAATITSPSNSAVFTSIPITVSGFCPNDLMVKIFKNGIFSGSVMCSNNSYSIQIDLFAGQNELIARVYDSLDQAGPDSNKVTVTYSTPTPSFTSVVSLTSNFARKGADPQKELQWPVIISGGTPPYAISVDWGDGSDADLYSTSTPGEFTIKHTYEQSGAYRVLVKCSDSNGSVAYLQLVAISNGQASDQADEDAAATGSGQGAGGISWQIMAITIPVIVTTFWLGVRYEKNQVKKRIEEGKHPY